MKKTTIGKALHYIRYFFYIAFNWNIPLAVFTIYHEVRGERKYKINTSKLNELDELTINSNNIIHAEIYQASNYYILEKCFDELNKYKLRNIVDMGCGKGRILAVAGFYGYKRITGVEFAEELCDCAEKNLEGIKPLLPQANFNIVHLDAADYQISKDEDVFFLSNPFKEVVMEQVVKNILQSIAEVPRKIFVVYINPQHKNLFTSKGFKERCYIKKLHLVEASILVNG